MRPLCLKSKVAFTATLLVLPLGACRENPVEFPNTVATNEEALSELEASKNGPTIPFADAEVFFERNLTDNDLGLQIFIDAEEWTSFDVSGPDHRKIVQVRALGTLSDLGITELHFESAEPSPAEVLALFLPGEYRFGGKTVDGQRLAGADELSHVFVAPFSFSPADGAEVDPNGTTVTWSAPGAELVEVIIENEENENVFDVVMEGDAGSLDIPPQFLGSGIEYKLELLAYHENGNRTILERSFTTQ